MRSHQALKLCIRAAQCQQREQTETVQPFSTRARPEGETLANQPRKE